MSANFCLPTRAVAEESGGSPLAETVEGYVSVAIVDATCNVVASVVLADGNILSGAPQMYPIDKNTGDMCELTLSTAEDFAVAPVGYRYRFEYRYRRTNVSGYVSSCVGTKGKWRKGSFWVPIQDANLYTLDPLNCVQVGINGATTCV